MATFVYPNNYDLRLVQQEKAPTQEKDRELLKRFPIRYTKAARVEWEQYDSHHGLMSVRGINGKPGEIQPLGLNRFSMKPGYYGNFRAWNETQQTELREAGTPNQPLDLRAEMAREQERMQGMRFDLVEWIVSSLVRTGKVLNRAADGTLLHTDTIGIAAALAPAVAWSTLATATPLADFRAWKVASQTGTNSKFGKGAEALMNAATLNYMLNNSNPADLGGKRLAVGSSVLGIDDLNKILAANDLPTVVEYDEQYRNDPSSPWTRFLPDGWVVMFGTRPAGQPIGEFQATINAQEDALVEEGVFGNDDRTGIYTRVIDTGLQTIPREIQLHHGMNGGLAIYYPTALRPAYVL
jgi:hypothetical protein